MFYDKEKKAGITIDLVPLINIVFLLLIFFLVAGTFSNIDNFADLDNPKALSGNIEDQGDIIISLTKDGKIYYNHSATSYVNLYELLRKLLKNNPEQSIILRADASLPASKLISLIQNIASLGGVNISIVTES